MTLMICLISLSKVFPEYQVQLGLDTPWSALLCRCTSWGWTPLASSSLYFDQCGLLQWSLSTAGRGSLETGESYTYLWVSGDLEWN